MLNMGDENGTFETSDILQNTTEIVSLLKKISPRCHDYLLKCVWGSKIVNCTDVTIIGCFHLVDFIIP